MVTVWFGVGQFLSGAMGQLYPGGDKRKWYVVDATGKPLGRLASEVAKILRGKNKLPPMLIQATM
jgi:hypothetical protein